MPSALQMKVIKPARFKDEAFKAAIKAAAKEVADEMVLDFRETTRSWKHKPVFEEIVSVDPNVEVLVGTDDEIYNFVNGGTKKHDIPKYKPGPLHFQWGGKGSYKAKTKPKVIGSTPGGPGGDWVTFKKVQHPGTKARKFDETIQKKWKPRFKTRMEKAMSEAAKDSGHGIP